MLLAVILTGQICVIMNHTLAFDHVMKAHLINYPVITEKQALLSRDYVIKTSYYPVIKKLFFCDLEITEGKKDTSDHGRSLLLLDTPQWYILSMCIYSFMSCNALIGEDMVLL